MSDQDRWVRQLNSGTKSDVPLICFAHVAGSASYYFPLATVLAANVEVLAIQYPGRNDRYTEKPIDNIPEIADIIAGLLKGLDRSQYAFFGHSMGATVAFEVARRLHRETGTGPAWLFASGRRAPSCRRDEHVHLRDDDGILEELSRVGGTDPRILNDGELRALILPAARNDYKAIERYEYIPGPPLSCPITALVGDEDSQTTIDEARAWRECTAADFCLHSFAGGHFYLESHVDDIAKIISASLNRLSP